MDLNKLKTPFPHHCISWRVGAMNKDKTKAIALAYIDARDVMERLDEVCGAGNWQCKHPHANGKTSCAIGIKIDGEWVWKENGAGDSQVEAEKGAFSDSLKRAAVLWGIGRYLYDVDNIWVEIDQFKKIKNPNDKRLSEALTKAEKGIRSPKSDHDDLTNAPLQAKKAEKKSAPDLTKEEYDFLKDGLNNAKTLEELKAAFDNVNAAKARMIDADLASLTKIKDLRKSDLMQATVKEAAE